jgi:uncharacterized protein YuzE
MNIEYDEETDAAYIWFLKDIEQSKSNYEGEIWPEELKGDIGMLFDSDNKLMGLEIMSASKYLKMELLSKDSFKKQ